MTRLRLVKPGDERHLEMAPETAYVKDTDCQIPMPVICWYVREYRRLYGEHRSRAPFGDKKLAAKKAISKVQACFGPLSERDRVRVLLAIALLEGITIRRSVYFGDTGRIEYV